MKATFFLISFLFYFLTNLACQQSNYIQFSGRIFNEHFQPMPFVTITIANSNRGTTSDNQGEFSFATSKMDTIVFSSIGYKKSYATIPDSIDVAIYEQDILMQADTIMLTEIEIYRWKDYEAFKKAFINLKRPETDLDRAKRNITLIKEQIIRDNYLSNNAGRNLMLDHQKYDNINKGVIPTYNILDANEWRKLFRAFKKYD